jgi:hypothetical protein
MARPTIETVSIVVDSNGKLITWSDGLLSGDAALVKEIRLNSEIKLPVPLSAFGPVVEADLNDVNNLAGVLAALTSANIGRTRILEAPDKVLDLIPIYNETTEYTGEDDDAEGEN